MLFSGLSVSACLSFSSSSPQRAGAVLHARHGRLVGLLAAEQYTRTTAAAREPDGHGGRVEAQRPRAPREVEQGYGMLVSAAAGPRDEATGMT